MHKEFASASDRRGFLRFGLLAGLVSVAGCGGTEEPKVATAPPVKGGNRKRLDLLGKGKVNESPAKKAEPTVDKKEEPPAEKKD